MTLTDSERFAAYGTELSNAIEEALPAWVRRAVELRLGRELDRHLVERPELDHEIDELGSAAAADVGGQLRDLLQRDVDDQWTNPLSIVRQATKYPNELLARYDVAEVRRDGHAERMLPDDVYDLAPANFAALSQTAHECGIRWGAAKAHLHLQRHKKS